MRIVHAEWEKRNLGVDCIEITIEKNDLADLSGTVKTISENIAEYTVVKVPAGAAEIMSALDDLRFNFIESMVILSHDLKCHEELCASIYKKMAKLCTCRKLEESELDGLFAELRKGMFNTDRIYLDKRFDKELAAKRYIGWLQDDYKRGVPLHEFYYKGKPFGFAQFSIDEQFLCKCSIGGVYSECDVPGAGYLFNYIYLCEVASQGGKKKIAYISSNNTKNLRLCFSLGYQYEGMSYVYIKHA
jgi:hypothetical protein